MPPTPPNFLAVQRARWAPYLLALLAITAFATFQETALPIVLGMAAALIARLVVDSPNGRPLPKTIINTAVVCATIFLWVELQSDDRNFVAALGHFITALLLCKFFERKHARDLYQMAILSLLLIVASAMYTSSMLFAFILLAFVVTLTFCMILFQMHASTTDARGRRDAWSAPLAQGTGLLRDMRKATFRCALVLVPLAMAVFLVLPRARGGSIFSRWGTGGGTFETGFSENIQFHDYGQLSQSDEVVMEVKLTRRGENMGSELFEPYFRGQALDVYKDAQWSRSTTSSSNNLQWEFKNGDAVIIPEETDNPNLVIQQYTLHHTIGRILFEMAPPVSIMSDQLRGIWYNRQNVSINSLGPDAAVVHYTVASLPISESAVIPGRPGSPGNMLIPREIAAMARTIVGDRLPPENEQASANQIRAMAFALENYLRANYPYSLEFRQQDHALDPTVDFLLNRKDSGGHCEYFASAMVMLCRSLGLNARIVNGYRGGDFNSIGEYYVVRQKHAHAWAEVYIPDEGWLQSDPTPSSLSGDLSESFVKRWTNEMLQLVQNAWQAAFVSFDNESRHHVMEWFHHLFQKPIDFFSDLSNAIAFSWVSPAIDRWVRFTLYGPIVGLIAICGWIFKRWRYERWRRLRVGTLYKPVRLSADTLFLDELFRLIAGRIPGKPAARLPHQTPHEFVEESVSALGHAAPDARWLVTTFYSIQFGAARPGTELRSQIATALRRIKEALTPAGNKVGAP